MVRIASEDPKQARKDAATRGLLNSYERAVLDRALSSHRSDGETIALLANVEERLDAIQIDQHGGSGEPEVHGRHQALPSRQKLRFVAESTEQLDRLLDRGRRVVVEDRRLHSLDSSG